MKFVRAFVKKYVDMTMWLSLNAEKRKEMRKEMLRFILITSQAGLQPQKYSLQNQAVINLNMSLIPGQRSCSQLWAVSELI